MVPLIHAVIWFTVESRVRWTPTSLSFQKWSWTEWTRLCVIRAVCSALEGHCTPLGNTVLSLQASTMWLRTNIASVKLICQKADSAAVPLRGRSTSECLVFPVQLPDLPWPSPCFYTEPLQATSYELDTRAALISPPFFFHQLATVSWSLKLRPLESSAGVCPESFYHSVSHWWLLLLFHIYSCCARHANAPHRRRRTLFVRFYLTIWSGCLSRRI